MSDFNHIKTEADMRKPVSEGGMSMGVSDRIVIIGLPGSCPESTDPQKKHTCIVTSCVQSVEEYRCTVCGYEDWD